MTVKTKLLSAVCVLSIAACRPPIYHTRNLAEYRVEDGRLSADFGAGQTVAPRDYLVLTLQKVCPSDFPDAFGNGVGVLAGAEISGFSYYDIDSHRWVQRDVKRTINTTGVYSRGCINFPQFPLGEYNYRDATLSIKLTLKRLENAEQKRFAEAIFTEAKTAITAATSGGFAAFVPVSDLVYTAVMDHNMGEAALLDFTIGFQPASTRSKLPFVPRLGRMTVLGEVQSDSWSPWAAGSDRPADDIVQQLVVRDNGELYLGDKQFTSAFYATLSLDRIPRNPELTPSLERLENELLLFGFRPGETGDEAKQKARALIEFVEQGTSRADFIAEEQVFLSNLTTCLSGWEHWWVAGGGSGDESDRRRLESIRTGCRPFLAATDGYAGRVVDAAAARELCRIDAPMAVSFPPLCSEYQMRVRMAQYLDAASESLDLIAKKDNVIAQVTATSAALSEALSAKKVEVGRVYAQLTQAGLDVEHITESLAAQKTAGEKARKLAEQYEALKNRVANLHLGGPDVVIRNNRIIVNLPNELFFESGKYQLSDTGRDLLRGVAGALRDTSGIQGRAFEVIGHTDNVPVAPGGPIADNWQLSFLRARSCHALLTAADGGGLSPAMLSIGAAADAEPIATNDTAEGRRKNRRVEIVVLFAADELIDLKAQIQP